MSTQPTAIPGMVRNIQQTVQYRTVTKQAQDVVVYIDGQNVLTNPYLGETGVAVHLNDFVSAYQASYDTDSMIPTASLMLSVRKEQDYLFRAPGGNHLLKTMSEVRVYMKGSTFSPRGNTVYRQVFHGFISSISYSQDNGLTNISLAMSGWLGMLEKMQVDVQPAMMSSSSQEVTPFSSTSWNLNPYEMIAWDFVYSSMIDGFEKGALRQAVMDQKNPYYQAVASNFIAKWQVILYDLAKDVHIFGTPSVDNVITEIQKHIKHSDAAASPMSNDHQAVAHDKQGTVSEPQNKANNEEFYAKIREYMPDMSLGNIQLLNGRVMSRLERLRYVVSLIGFEAYQDIDGATIIKPPLYNLDVTNIGEVASAHGETSLIDIYDYNNPFVVVMDDIINEVETEDEAGVRLTRITAQGSLNPSFQMSGTEPVKAVSEEIDIPKLAQFGLRTEPPIHAAWFRDGDSKGIYAYAVSELARANRSFRTITITIPVRPELKLGFPMYLAHRDLYGYIKNVQINYTQGSGAVTMTVTLDSLRRRPMFPKEHTVPNGDGTSRNVVIMTEQPNLVMRWTKPPTVVPAGQSAADLTNRVATLPTPADLVFDQQIQVLHFRKQKIGNNFGSESDTTSNSWRVQADAKHVFDGQGTEKSPRSLNAQYFEDLRKTRPYTDDKGYELVGPFPWGRWKSLRDAIYDFTISDVLGSNGSGGSTSKLNPAIKPQISDTVTMTNASAFMFTAEMGTTNTADTASNVLDAMQTQSRSVANNKIFELAYDATQPPASIAGFEQPTTVGASTGTLNGYSDEEDNAATRAVTFLDGAIKPTNTTLAILKSITPQTFTPQGGA